MCDFCGKYTHLLCEPSMPKPMYDLLEANPTNPLTYFCPECRPTLVPNNGNSLWAGFLDRISDIVNSQKREALAEKIMNTMSTKIEHLDDMVREHRAAAAAATSQLGKLEETVTHYQKFVIESQAAMDSTKQALEMSQIRIEALVSEVSKHRPRPTHPIPVHTPLSHPEATSLDPSRSMPYSDADPSRSMHYPTPLENLHHQMPPNAPSRSMPYSDPDPSRSMLYPTPFESIHRQMPPRAPFYSDIASIKPTNPLAYPGPPSFRGPPLVPKPPPQQPPPDPDNTLVVYNTDKTDHVRIVVEDLMTRCNIYQSEVIYANKLIKTSNNRTNSPIYIRCDCNITRWNFIRDINKLRYKYDDEQIYARPYLNDEDLRADRNLYRKLTDVRKRHEGRTFKIHKGQIYEKTNSTFDKYVEEALISSESDGGVSTPQTGMSDVGTDSKTNPNAAENKVDDQS